MNEFRHILVPIDGGAPSELALDLALDFAQKDDARVTLLHAYEVPVVAYGMGIHWPFDEFRTAAQDTLDRALRRARARYRRVDGVLAYGGPRQTILEVVDQSDVDLIVMGTHAHRGLSRAFFSGVAERVVRASRVPVMTVSGIGPWASAA
jgi:nucleotide-binding universal stress UspA family protein